MPYINPNNKVKFEDLTNLMFDTKIETPGELNFLITKLCLSFLRKHTDTLTFAKYQDYNDVMGALEGAKLEMYRRAVAPYENKKIDENGDVYPGDNND